MTVAMICKMAGIQLYLPKQAVTLAGSLHPDHELQHFQKVHGCKIVEDNEQLLELIKNESIKSIMLPTPESYLKCRKTFPGMPMIFRCSEGADDRIKQYADLNADFYLCKNKRLAGMMGPKAIYLPPLVGQAPSPLPTAKRSGYRAYVHKLERFWPIAAMKFNWLKASLGDIDIKVHGLENPDGPIKDSEAMPASRATIHLRDKGMTDYAVVKSIMCGIPVITDRDTVVNGYLEDIVVHGESGLIAESVDEMAALIKKCEDNDFLDDLTTKTKKFSQSMMEPDWSSLCRFKEATGSKSPTRISFIIPCMGRLDAVKKTISSVLTQPHSECVFVDYSCPENSGEWVERNCPTARVVKVSGEDRFNLAKARNAGAAAARGDVFCFMDADIRIDGELSTHLVQNMAPKQAMVVHCAPKSTTGMIACWRSDFAAVGGYDENYEGWGCDDMDFRLGIQAAGVAIESFPSRFVFHFDHWDADRVRFYSLDKAASVAVNSRYFEEKKKARKRGADKAALAILYSSIRDSVAYRLSIAEKAKDVILGPFIDLGTEAVERWSPPNGPPRYADWQLSDGMSKDEESVYGGVISRLLGMDTLLVYDVNPGLGASTRLIAERAPCAFVVAINSYEIGFLENVFDYRHRVIPIGFGDVLAKPFFMCQPDLIKLAGLSPEDAAEVVKKYPFATHVGTRWATREQSSKFADLVRTNGASYEEVSQCCWICNKKQYFR